MSRYYSYEIIRDNAKDVILENGVKHRCIDPDALLDVEPADVVEVVRCKDCIHYNEYASGEKIIDEEEVCDGWCMRWSGIENVNRHDYCSYGEEKHD